MLRKLYTRELAAIERDEPLTKFPIPGVAGPLRLDGDMTATAAPRMVEAIDTATKKRERRIRAWLGLMP